MFYVGTIIHVGTLGRKTLFNDRLQMFDEVIEISCLQAVWHLLVKVSHSAR